MGEVRDRIEGAAPARTGGSSGVVEQVRALADEVSRLTVIKDADVENEGPSLRADNVRKAGLLRAASSLLRAARVILEDY